MQGVLDRREGDIHHRAIDKRHARPEYGRRQRQPLASLRQVRVKNWCRPNDAGLAGRPYETNCGLRIIKTLQNKDYGLRAFVFEDPEGNRIDVGQPI